MDYDEVQLAGDGELIQRSPYLPYSPGDTCIKVFVVSTEPIRVRQGWTLAKSVKAARELCREKFGDILEERAAGDNLFLRVRKAAK